MTEMPTIEVELSSTSIVCCGLMSAPTDCAVATMLAMAMLHDSTGFRRTVCIETPMPSIPASSSSMRSLMNVPCSAAHASESASAENGR